jgi:hypothetical protein
MNVDKEGAIREAQAASAGHALSIALRPNVTRANGRSCTDRRSRSTARRSADGVKQRNNDQQTRGLTKKSQAKRNDHEEVSLFRPQNGLDNGSTAMNSISERVRR